MILRNADPQVGELSLFRVSRPIARPPPTQLPRDWAVGPSIEAYNTSMRPGVPRWAGNSKDPPTPTEKLTHVDLVHPDAM